MESEVTGNYHASFGERDGETRGLRDMKVRSVPTLLSPLLAHVALHGMETDMARYGKGARVIRYADDLVGATRCCML